MGQASAPQGAPHRGDRPAADAAQPAVPAATAARARLPVSGAGPARGRLGLPHPGVLRGERLSRREAGALTQPGLAARGRPRPAGRPAVHRFNDHRVRRARHRAMVVRRGARAARPGAAWLRPGPRSARLQDPSRALSGQGRDVHAALRFPAASAVDVGQLGRHRGPPRRVGVRHLGAGPVLVGGSAVRVSGAAAVAGAEGREGSGPGGAGPPNRATRAGPTEPGQAEQARPQGRQREART